MCNYATDLRFDVIPTSITVYLMDSAEFHCVASCDGIFWLINDRFPGVDHNIDTRSETRLREDGQPGEESRLWITATARTNNSVVECGVENRRLNFEAKADPAYLTIQGAYKTSIKRHSSMHDM